QVVVPIDGETKRHAQTVVIGPVTIVGLRPVVAGAKPVGVGIRIAVGSVVVVSGVVVMTCMPAPAPAVTDNVGRSGRCADKSEEPQQNRKRSPLPETSSGAHETSLSSLSCLRKRDSSARVPQATIIRTRMIAAEAVSRT